MNDDLILPEEQAQALLSLDEDVLRTRLGMQLSAVYDDPSRSLQSPAQLVGPQALALTPPKLPAWVPAAVEALIQRAKQGLANVLCSQDLQYADIRAKLIEALGIGDLAVVAALTAFLAGPLGISLAVAGIVATILVKMVGEPALRAGVQEVCAGLNQPAAPGAPAGGPSPAGAPGPVPAA